MTPTDDLLELENRFWSASGDRDFWDGNFAQEGLVVVPGQIMEKRAVVDAQSGAESWERFEMADVHRIDVSDDVAMLSYRAAARRTGDADDYVALISSVYARRYQAWKLMLHQQTPA